MGSRRPSRLSPVAGIGRDLAFVDATRKPIAEEHGHGAIFRAVDTILEDRHGEMEFEVLDRVAEPARLRGSLEEFRRAVLAHEPDEAREENLIAEQALAIIQSADAKLSAL